MNTIYKKPIKVPEVVLKLHCEIKTSFQRYQDNQVKSVYHDQIPKMFETWAQALRVDDVEALLKLKSDLNSMIDEQEKELML